MYKYGTIYGMELLGMDALPNLHSDHDFPLSKRKISKLKVIQESMLALGVAILTVMDLRSRSDPRS